MGDVPVFIFNFPRFIKPFYAKAIPGRNTVSSWLYASLHVLRYLRYNVYQCVYRIILVTLCLSLSVGHCVSITV